MLEKPCLLKEDGLNIDALSHLFDSTTTSYKYLWTFALLKYIISTNKDEILFSDMLTVMLTESIVPISRFKLKFGFYDRIEEQLKNLAEIPAIREQLLTGTFNPSDVENNKYLTKTYKDLLRYVSHRWLHPFCLKQGKKDRKELKTESKVRREIMQIAKDSFYSHSPPPYKLTDNSLILHPHWRNYFKKNIVILRAWGLWNWTSYLQKCNPNIPAINNKIGFPESREQWQGEPEFWGKVMEKTTEGLFCIYSGEKLEPNQFELDHYVPWSFIGHNRPWNIVPVHKLANAGKGDQLPHVNYLNHFVNMHHNALNIWHRYFPRDHKKMVEAYCLDLQLTFDNLTNKDKLSKALIRTILPIIEVAKNNSFKSDWFY